MTVRATARLIGAAVIGAAALFGAVLIRQPEPAIIAAPFLTVAMVGMVMRPLTVTASVAIVPSRVVQGERSELVVTLVSPGGWTRTRVRVELPVALAVQDGELDREVLVGTEPRSLSWTLVANQWGAIGSSEVTIEATDLLGSMVQRSEIMGVPLRVLPRESTVRQITAPHSLRSVSGSHLSRQRGDGIEFADTREFVAGDRARDVNWRVSARRQELWVNERRPERNGDVVVFLDSFASFGDTMDNTLRRTVELAEALTRRHLAANDRVGLVDLGGVLRWVRPGGGAMQRYRIAEALIETELWASGGDKTVDVLPPRALPRRCLVLALTPLLDRRGIDAIVTLRARGFDVAVIEVSAVPFVASGSSRAAELAHRMWMIEQASVRHELRSIGIAVGQWSDGEPLDPVLEAVGVFRTAVLRAAR